MSVYDIGQEFRTFGTFTDSAGTAYDPGTVRLRIQPRGEVGTYYTYNSGDGVVVRQNTGTYYADLTTTRGGYLYRGWEGTGTITTTVYDRLFVRYLEG